MPSESDPWQSDPWQHNTTNRDGELSVKHWDWQENWFVEINKLENDEDMIQKNFEQ